MILPSIKEIHTMNFERKVVIVVGVEPPRRVIENINLVDYELGVMFLIKSNRK